MANESSINVYEDFHGNKFNKLLKERQLKQDPEKVISNYSNISLSDADKSLIVKGLNNFKKFPFHQRNLIMQIT